MKPILHKEKINEWFVVAMLLLASLSIFIGTMLFPMRALGAMTEYESNLQEQQIWYANQCFYVNAKFDDAGTTYAQLALRVDGGSEDFFGFTTTENGWWRSGCINLEALLTGKVYDRVKLTTFDGGFSPITSHYPYGEIGEGLFQFSSSTAETSTITGGQFTMVSGTAFFFVTIFTILYAFRGK